jgi:hypothetical protein
MEPIEIPRDVADAEGVPDDLDSGVVGPYRFPNPKRRRLAAAIYGVAAVVAALLTGFESGFWVVAGIFVVLAVYHLLAAWDLAVEQEDALERATGAVDFSVGHVSAAVGFEGWRARPIWNVIVYSATEPPDRRALVRLDGRSGEQLDDVYVEPLATEA